VLGTGGPADRGSGEGLEGGLDELRHVAPDGRELAGLAYLLKERIGEIDVLHAMAEGRTNAAIARTLHLSASSIDQHINSIFSKLGLREEPDLHHRVRAVLTYLQHQPER
jgi:DNA-binding NarL/FixJ family response regulator